MQAVAMDNQRIPMPLTSLVGRAEEIARLTSLLMRPDVRLVTLMGPGGVGKTRLALHIANDIDEEVVGDIRLVLLANTTEPEAVLPAIARALGGSQMSTVPLEEQIADAIGLQPMLLILDNAEQIAEHLTFLSDLVGACHNLTVLVTSRVMLRLSAEHVFPVDPLPTRSADIHRLAPATALFIERAQAVHPDLSLTTENLQAIDDICRKVDGLPLAIELAAARTRFLSPVAMRDRLAERLSLLVGGPRDAPERHRTLRATLTWSHDLLNSDERVLFRRLAVCINGVPYDAIEPICNASGDLGDRVEELLASLVDHSLVRIDDRPETGPRVRLLHTIREFAQEHLELSGETEALCRAHALWFANIVIETPAETWRTGTAELRRWTTRHLPDMETFSIVLDRLMEFGYENPALQVTAQLVPFWIEMGQIREAREWTQRVLPYADDAPIHAQAAIYRMAAIVFLDADEVAVALPYAERALELARVIGEPRLIANSQNLLGSLYWQSGDPEKGEHFQRAAIATVNDTGDPLGGALFSAQLADRLIEHGELDRAEPLLTEAAPLISRERPDALPMLHGSMAILSLVRGRLDEAGHYLERGLSYHRPPPHRRPDMLAMLLMVASELAARRDLPEEGTQVLATSMVIAERIGLAMSRSMLADIERIETTLRAQISADRYDDAWKSGRMLSRPDAIDLALSIASIRSAGSMMENGSSAQADDDLTPREREVLALLVAGKSNAAIAEELFIIPRTVTTHLSRLYTKLEVSTRTEAISAAMCMGLVPQS
jgi:predicted ATPase/DNA-binding CsgD family transcriptional regulator